MTLYQMLCEEKHTDDEGLSMLVRMMLPEVKNVSDSVIAPRTSYKNPYAGYDNYYDLMDPMELYDLD